MIFDSAAYLSDIQRTDNLANARRVERGFSAFVCQAADRAVNLSKANVPSIVELGIGGGGSHEMWKKYFSGAVYGADLFDKSKREVYNTELNYGHYRDNFDRIAADTGNAKNILDDIGVKTFWGMSAYHESTAIEIKAAHGEPIDFVLDDAAPGGGALNGLMAAWRDHIADTGAIVTETPFGNGTQEVFSKSQEEKLECCRTLAQQGMIVFDMSEYMATRDPVNTQYIVSYLGFFSPDYSNYNDLLTKYKHNIVAGKENWQGI